MRTKYFIAVIILLVFLPLVAGETVNLDFVIEKALEKSLSIETEMLEYKNQVSYRKQSYYNWLPSLNLNIKKSIIRAVIKGKTNPNLV